MKITMTDFGVSGNSVIVGWAGARPFVCLGHSTDVQEGSFLLPKSFLASQSTAISMSGRCLHFMGLIPKIRTS